MDFLLLGPFAGVLRPVFGDVFLVVAALVAVFFAVTLFTGTLFTGVFFVGAFAAVFKAGAFLDVAGLAEAFLVDPEPPFAAKSLYSSKLSWMHSA